MTLDVLGRLELHLRYLAFQRTHGPPPAFTADQAAVPWPDLEAECRAGLAVLAERGYVGRVGPAFARWVWRRVRASGSSAGLLTPAAALVLPQVDDLARLSAGSEATLRRLRDRLDALARCRPTPTDRITGLLALGHFLGRMEDALRVRSWRNVLPRLAGPVRTGLGLLVAGVPGLAAELPELTESGPPSGKLVGREVEETLRRAVEMPVLRLGQAVAEAARTVAPLRPGFAFDLGPRARAGLALAERIIDRVRGADTAGPLEAAVTDAALDAPASPADLLALHLLLTGVEAAVGPAWEGLPEPVPTALRALALRSPLSRALDPALDARLGDAPWRDLDVLASGRVARDHLHAALLARLRDDPAGLDGHAGRVLRAFQTDGGPAGRLLVDVVVGDFVGPAV